MRSERRGKTEEEQQREKQKQRQCTSTWQTLMHFDVWAMAYHALQQRRGQRYGLTSTAIRSVPSTTKPIALAKQATATPPLQVRPCVPRRPGKPLAPSGSRSVRPKRDLSCTKPCYPARFPISPISPNHRFSHSPGCDPP